MPLFEKNEAAYSFTERVKRKPALFVAPKQRREVEWEMMTMTMTIGLDARITFGRKNDLSCFINNCYHNLLFTDY